MKYTFDKDKFTVDTPLTPRNWSNKLFNDEYVMELDQTMQGSSLVYRNFNTKEFIRKSRHFYVKDIKSGKVFCPLYLPLRTKAESYCCTYGLGEQSVESISDGMKVKISAFVPKKGFKEIWSISVKNISSEQKEISLFSVFSFEDFSWMGSQCEFDENINCIVKHSFPSHAFYEDKEKLDNELKYVYAYCDKKVDSYETNKYRFYGCDNEGEMPVAVEKGKCGNTITQGMESILAAFENKIILENEEEYIVNFVLGVAAHREDIKNEIITNIEKERSNISDIWKNRTKKFCFKTENKELNDLANYWLKKQVAFLSRTNRLDFSSPVRNELQDSMGYAFSEPEEAFRIVKHVMERQEISGYIKQWNIHDGSGLKGLSLLRHSDAPIWLIICFIEIISYIIKDNSLYNEMVSYSDSKKTEPISQHLKRAAYFMTDKAELGSHGLCLMRDGDWTDPMNGVGRKGRGESVWNTMAIIYAIKELIKIFPDKELEERAKCLCENVNKYCWDGKWYLAAIDDDGRKIGTFEDEEGKIFLNTQTWAVISGVAQGERLALVKTAIETLRTVCGYKLSDPPFSRWNEKWGKISIKQQGALENGAVYCHGTLFKAFGDYILGDYEEAMKTILSVLPTNPLNPPAVNMQLPTFISNYYFGIENENFGRSSCVYNTGTSSWILVILNRIFNGQVGN